jgi:hypothetical protein
MSASVKRDLLQCQKRPITVSKETYTWYTRAACQHLYPRRKLCRQKHHSRRELEQLDPGAVAKETYYRGKRDLQKHHSRRELEQLYPGAVCIPSPN